MVKVCCAYVFWCSKFSASDLVMVDKVDERRLILKGRSDNQSHVWIVDNDHESYLLEISRLGINVVLLLIHDTQNVAAVV